MRGIKLLFLLILPLFGNTQQLGFALEQIDGQAIIEKGLTGKGVKIGIIDGGYLGADENISLKPHFLAGRVAYYKDFVTPEMSEYGGNKRLGDDHGSDVWEMIGGIHSEKKVQFGLATNATYYLARTDHDIYEKRQEEKYLIQAMHEMIQHGVKLFNISLGYTNGYTKSSENYTPEMIDGKSTWITNAMDSMLAIHDVLVVVSAGNDGNEKWRTLSAPADAKNVLSIGATKLNQSEEMRYSSIGPTSLDYVKPDISCFSATGTSFSAPVITGLIACMMEYDSTLSPTQLKEFIIQSSNLYPYANNHVGYGVPSSTKILMLLEGQLPTNEVRIIETSKQRITLKIEESSGHMLRTIVYHRQNDWQVILKETLRWTDKTRITRPEGCTRSTVLFNKEVFEIVWKE